MATALRGPSLTLPALEERRALVLAALRHLGDQPHRGRNALELEVRAQAGDRLVLAGLPLHLTHLDCGIGERRFERFASSLAFAGFG